MTMPKLRIKTNKSAKTMMLDRIVKLAIAPYKNERKAASLRCKIAMEDAERAEQEAAHWKKNFQSEHKRYEKMQKTCLNYKIRFERLKAKE